MTTTEGNPLQARVDELEAQNAELRRKLRLYAPSEGLPGNRVMPVFFGLIFFSMVVAVGLWVLGRKTARARALRPVVAAAPGRVDDAGWALVRGLHSCLAEVQPNEVVDVRLEVRLTPAGTLGLTDAAIKPNHERFVPCVRRTPAGVKVEAAREASAGQQAPLLELRYLVEPTQEGTYQARWSWRQLP
ncbi:MAG: hypothetical protein RMJ98_11715 [Myxococcales bacterium]|nr:hypothetical protein [Polyangiaceae bacterium]MDW8249955.1 hypothetical protein [Myxococcales bacterium]